MQLLTLTTDPPTRAASEGRYRVHVLVVGLVAAWGGDRLLCVYTLYASRHDYFFHKRRAAVIPFRC
jgi:hypothetical protein